MPTLEIRYFARCRELAGTGSDSIEVADGATCGDVLAAIMGRHPALEEVAPIVRLALNMEMCDAGVPVSDGDELALIPPVSGGAPVRGRFAIRQEAFGTDAAVELLGPGDGSSGALATFVGIVRRDSRGKSVTHLDYEAYVPMALGRMEAIGSEIEKRWNVEGLAIVHRTGRLCVGDVAVSIAVRAAHRAEALEGCRYAIDRLKDDVPIWKKETGEDGSEWWSEGS